MNVPAQADPATLDRSLRIALLAWGAAGWRTQQENLQRSELPPGVVLDTIAVEPHKTGGWIERLPLLQSTHKGTLRSTSQILPLLVGRPYDVVLTQVLLPVLPLVAAGTVRLRRQSTLVYANDWTPKQMDDFSPIYFGKPAAGAAKRAVRDSAARYVLRHCAAVVAWSHWAADSFVRDYGVPSERVHVIWPGVNLTEWQGALSSASGGAPREGPFQLLFVGADFERKGGPLLLEVFRECLRDTCELHLVTRADVPAEPGVHVHRGFGPNEPGLRELYSNSDALVLPTRADCFSLASLEAMASGLPVISCPVGGIPEIIQDGETGFLVPPDDGAALQQAISTLVADRSRAAEMGRAGRLRVEQYFDNTERQKALFDLLLQIHRQEMCHRQV